MQVEFDGLAEVLLGHLTKPRKGFSNVFDIFAAVDEGWSAMEMRAGKNKSRRKRTASIKLYSILPSIKRTASKLILLAILHH